jgi:alpha-glucosidase
VPPAGVDPWRHHAGGTLDGIAAQLGHIAELGADAVYLTPIFRAPSNHKYDTQSYDEVDPAFGGAAAFEALAAACQARGLGLILDGVFNHVSEQHAWFREARADAASPRVGYFRFERHPEEYARWRGMGWLPELDLAHPAVGRELWGGDESVVRRWLRRGATGWRLDCANDLGRAVCGQIAQAARHERAPDGVIGEVMTYADAWTREGVLDGVMNYYFRESVVGLCRGQVPPPQTAYNLKRTWRAYRREALLRSWNILATHDTPRLASLVGDAGARRLAWTLAFAAPGVPLCYYGEEIGMEGGADPANRAPMIWDQERWDQGLLQHVRRLAGVRRAERALREGDYLPLPQPGIPQLLAFARTTDQPAEAVFCLCNASPEPLRARVFAPYAFLFDALPLHDLLGQIVPGRVEAGAFDVELPPWGHALLAPDDTRIPGYRFFRGQ